MKITLRPAFTLACALAMVLPVGLYAQTSAPPQKSAAKKAVAKPPASRVEAKSKANQMATGIQAADDALTPAELAIAERVYQGKLPCELGASVTLTPDPKSPGYFNVQVKNLKFRMFPVATTTGAIRLEDKKAGAVWLQLANKSMLMNQKLGQRLADACMSPAQVAVEEAMQKNPVASVLDAPAPPAASAASAAAAGLAAAASPTAIAASPAASAASPAASAASAPSSTQ